MDTGAARIAHVERAVGCEVDHDLAGHRQLRHRRALGIACFCEQANMRSDDEVVAILACEPGDYVAAEAVPGRQLALEMRRIKDRRPAVSEQGLAGRLPPRPQAALRSEERRGGKEGVS